MSVCQNACMNGQRILVVDDDPDIRRLLGAYLRNDGFQVVEAADGEAALRLEATERPDLVVLDLMLPSVGGMDVLRALRTQGSRPVIVLTARDDVTDRVLGLELGADDYVTKPFHPRELVARIHSVLRRVEAPADDLQRHGDLEIDFGRREVRRGDERVSLTRTEFDLLAALAHARGRVLTRAQLLEAVAGPEAFTLERSIDSHVRNLRRKLEPTSGDVRYVITVKGVGYRLGES
jgi:DNA-binding response OmpR family regulator